MKLTEQERRELLIQVSDNRPAVQVLEEAREIYDNAKENVLLHGKICDDDFKLDFRFRLGVMYGIDQIFKRVNDAKKLAN